MTRGETRMNYLTTIHESCIKDEFNYSTSLKYAEQKNLVTVHLINYLALPYEGYVICPG